MPIYNWSIIDLVYGVLPIRIRFDLQFYVKDYLPQYAHYVYDIGISRRYFIVTHI